MKNGKPVRSWACEQGDCTRVLMGKGRQIDVYARQHMMATHGQAPQGPIESWDPRGEQAVTLVTASAPPIDLPPAPGVTGGPQPPNPAPAASRLTTTREEMASITAGLAEMNQRLGSIEESLAHPSGLCADEKCLTCRRDRVTLGQDVTTHARREVFEEIDQAAERFGLTTERDRLASAVFALRRQGLNGAAQSPTGDTVTITG